MTEKSHEILPVQSSKSQPQQRAQTDGIPAGKNTEMTAEVEVHESEYGKHYRMGPQERESRSLARREKQEKVEQELRRDGKNRKPWWPSRRRRKNKVGRL